MYQNKRVILIVPFFNEKERIAEVIKKTEQTSIDEVCALISIGNAINANVRILIFVFIICNFYINK